MRGGGARTDNAWHVPASEAERDRRGVPNVLVHGSVGEQESLGEECVRAGVVVWVV